ncbi:MAG: putative DNA binding domain-containing protein [Methanomassiliicoccaceae archaeon]|nr:putative DNA binding domain-containing protein [Methanomassiliicoccaceae archaeon]
MESQITEWKRSWNPDYMKTIAAFSNTDGGQFIIGIEDDGTVTGIEDPRSLLKMLPDTIKNKLGITPSVEVVDIEGKSCIMITVKKGDYLVDLDGAYYRRAGSTTQRITGGELKSLLLFDAKMSWTDMHAKGVGLEDLSKEAIGFFVKKGLESKRISSKAAETSNEPLLKRHGFMDEGGLRNSAAILFLEEPGRTFYSSVVKIGAFDEGGRLIRLDAVDCPAVMQPDKAMGVLLSGYILGTDVVEGLMMVRRYPYPERALREAVMNAICHRDYSSVVETAIRVYPDHVSISNPCIMPPGWTKEDFLTLDESKPPNPAIAQAFFEMGYIERYGTGIAMIMDECRKMNLPLPEYRMKHVDVIEVTFRLPEKKGDGTTGKIPAGVHSLSDKEAEVCELIQGNSRITISDMSKKLGLTTRQVELIIASLKEKGIVERAGSKKAGSWVFLT